jgi:hypothetical protein
LYKNFLCKKPSASNYSFGIAENSIGYGSIILSDPNTAISTVKWCNAGTMLNTKCMVGTIEASSNSSLVKLSSAIHKIYVQPEDNVQ